MHYLHYSELEKADSYCRKTCQAAVSLCTVFVWQGFGSGATSVRSCQKLPPCPAEQMPAGSKMDQAPGQGQAHQ